MLISATKLSCCLLWKPSLLFFLSERLRRRERGGRKIKKGTSKPVARTRRNMKVDLLESGKEEGRTRERNSGTVFTSWMKQDQAAPPDNETVVQEQCRAAGQNSRDIETSGNWASGTSPLLSSSYSSYVPLIVTHKSLLVAHQMTLSACYLQFALLPSSPERNGEYWVHYVTWKYFCWVTKFYTLLRLTSILLQSARSQILREGF